MPEECSGEVRPALAKGATIPGPLTGTLADLAGGGFLVPGETDEDGVLRTVIDRRLHHGRTLHLILMPTEDCNFRCVYCYEQFKRHKMQPEVQDSLVQWVDANAHRYDHLFVEWFGGEPLHAADVVLSLGRRLKTVAESRGLTYRSGMSTNGYNLDPAMAEQLIAIDCNSFSITLDGVQDEHDQRRVLADGSPTFERIIGNLQALKQTDLAFSVRLRHNYDSANLPQAEEFLNFLAVHFAGDPRFADVSMRKVARWGGPNDENLAVCDAHDGIRARYDLLQRAQKRGFHEQEMKAHLQPHGYVCYASDPNSLIIGADGKIMKCTLELDTRDRNVVGQVQPGGVLELDEAKIAPWVMCGADDAHCRSSCFMGPACQGAACAKARFDLGVRPCPDDKRHITQVLRLINEHEEDMDVEEVLER